MSKHIVGAVQSSYLPWKGYFDIIQNVDTFVFYDDVQFTKSDWRSRNRVKTPNGPLWLSIPAGPSIDRLICEVELRSHDWQRKHWTSIKQSYAKAPYFKMYQKVFEDIYLGHYWRSLSELNQFIIRTIAKDILGINTQFRDSREFGLQGKRQDRLLNLLRSLGATHYVSGPSAQDYIDQKAFEEAGIHLGYHSYSGYPEYPQLYPPFEHQVSVLDLIFNTGPQAPHYIWGHRESRS
ncbi:WbqC family protein [Dyella choica]|uniref:WbqC family protein n=1 Tax=Dyella choica TaxID=1927959 RepID=A0A432M3B1_9GAMM|nr:WbqC family protein [Dyella choica]RUL73100.1 hypothetical protein EKH80_15680 [Dyella choica]